MPERGYRRFFRLRRDPQRDLNRELGFHLEMRAREFEEAGYDPSEARRLAEECFGDVAAIERRLKRQGRLRGARRFLLTPITETLRDLRFGIRTLRKDPGFAAVAILTLTIAIAASGAVFTVVDNVLLRPLNYREPDRLMTVWSATPVSRVNTSVSYPDFQDWRDNTTAFEALAFLRGVDFVLETGAAPDRYTAALVSRDFPAVLGARAELGSLESLGGEPGGEPLVVMKHSVWRGRFGGDPSIVGTTLTFSGSSYRVAAVLERGVDYPVWADFYVALTPELVRSEGLDSRDYRLDNRVVGRLAPGVTAAEARSELQVMTERLAQVYAETNEGWGASVVPLTDQTVGGVRQSLVVLLAAVGAVLLIACGNLASLSLARAVSRQREFAVRVAMGAGGLRIARQVLAESFVLAAAGTVLGVVTGNLALSLFVRRGIPGLPRIDEIALDARVLAVAALAAVCVSVLFGIGPAVLASRSRLSFGVRGATSNRGVGVLRSFLVVTQVALAMVLMIGATLLLASFQRLRSQDPGFDVDGLVSLRVNPPDEFTGRPAERYQLYRELVAETAALPSVESAAVVSHVPLSGTGLVSPVQISGVTDAGSVWLRPAGAGFFEVLGIPILRGRTLTAADHEGRIPYFVVSAAFVRSFFPEDDPLGRTITIWRQAASDPDYGEPIVGRIVGVAGDVRRVIAEEPDEPVVYLPLSLHTWTSVYLVVRPKPGTVTVGDELRRAVGVVDRRIPLGDLRTVASFVSSSTVREGFLASFGLAFSAVATVLALVGVYGVLAYMARQRAREIGVRIALGAVPARVARTFLGRGLVLVGLGLGIGVIAAFWATRILNTVLFQTSPTDPAAFLGVAASLLVFGGAAGWIPARRASRIDPNIVLREE